MTTSGQANSPSVNLDSESVAGEEDPGAAIDMSPAGASASSVSGKSPQPFSAATGVNPGDEAPAGTPGSGENICRDCGGSGQIASGPCKTCGGTGKVNVGLGGG